MVKRCGSVLRLGCIPVEGFHIEILDARRNGGVDLFGGVREEFKGGSEAVQTLIMALVDDFGQVSAAVKVEFQHPVIRGIRPVGVENHTVRTDPAVGTGEIDDLVALFKKAQVQAVLYTAKVPAVFACVQRAEAQPQDLPGGIHGVRRNAFVAHAVNAGGHMGIGGDGFGIGAYGVVGALPLSCEIAVVPPDLLGAVRGGGLVVERRPGFQGLQGGKAPLRGGLLLLCGSGVGVDREFRVARAAFDGCVVGEGFPHAVGAAGQGTVEVTPPDVNGGILIMAQHIAGVLLGNGVLNGGDGFPSGIGFPLQPVCRVGGDRVAAAVLLDEPDIRAGGVQPVGPDLEINAPLPHQSFVLCPESRVAHSLGGGDVPLRFGKSQKTVSHIELPQAEHIAAPPMGIGDLNAAELSVRGQIDCHRPGDGLALFPHRLGGKGQLFTRTVRKGFLVKIEQFLACKVQHGKQGGQHVVRFLCGDPGPGVCLDIGVALSVRHHAALLTAARGAPPEGIAAVFDEMGLPAHAAGIGPVAEEQIVLVGFQQGAQTIRELLDCLIGLRQGGVCRRSILGFSIGAFRCFWIRQQTHRHEQYGDHRQQTEPEGGTAVAQHLPDPALHADLSKGHGTGGKMGLPGRALQQGRCVALPLLQLHELHHPFVAGQLDVFAQQNIGKPYQRVEPVDGQGQKADHFEPVVTLLQMGALVGQDVLPDCGRKPRRNVDLRADEAQNKGGIDPTALPAAGDLHCVPDLVPQAQVGINGVYAEKQRHAQPEIGERGLPGESRF